MSEAKGGKARSSEPEESFFLSMLPFAGLALLLVLALVWNYLPERSSEGDSSSGGVDRVELAVTRWERMPAQEIAITSGRDFMLGPEDAPVTIVEFSDFECPFCRTASFDVKQVLDEYGERVRLVFKNLPLDMACNERMTQQLHPNACEAALFARCAGRQGEDLFWKTHDALFDAGEVSEEVFDSVAAQLDLDADALEACMADDEPLAEIEEDVQQAYELGLTGTPTFFVNGRKLSDYRNEAMAAVVERALADN